MQMQGQLIFTRAGIALRVVLMVLFAGGVAPWLTLRAWEQLPHPFETHLVVGAGVTRALVTLCMAWLLFPYAFRSDARHPAKRKGSLRIAPIIAIAAILARVGAVVATPNTQGHWHGFTWTQLGYLTAFGIGTAVFEEVLFRFVLLGRLAQVAGIPLAFTVQVLLFTLVHLDSGPVAWSQMSHAAFAGCALSLIYLKNRSLWPAITLHFVYNVLTAAIFGISIDGVQVYPMLVADNFGKVNGVMAAAIAFAGWTGLLAIKRLRAPRQSFVTGVVHG
ncbi:CPBP family intramembrane glutamic endopeptidase [Mitsuaria sp. 7]|uniref:CPBP family intramembrane glutamic endopeptidase n=1 Tax=Mitsuaria sp. 7 TaxID=1658665 RepID=UPI00082DEB3A|nr:CPBP family intramembrane glutamic endopeptidase [Mitsuaria sp. 7]